MSKSHHDKFAAIHASFEFYEIDRLYEMDSGWQPAQFVRDDRGNPQPAFHFGTGVYEHRSDGDDWFDMDGKRIPEPWKSFKAFPGVYRGYTGEQRPIFRLFARQRATPVAGKHVYVFSADSLSGEGFRLIHELVFDGKGTEHQEIDPTGDTDARGPACRRLELCTFHGIKRRERFWFAHLAPRPLPRRLVGALRALPDVQPQDQRRRRSPTAAETALIARFLPRCASLRDRWVVDLVPLAGGDPLPLEQAPDRAQAYVHRVYLLDAFEEALHRAADLQHHVDYLNEKRKVLSADRRYALAKRIQAFRGRSREMAEMLDSSFESYLAEKEWELLSAHRRAEVAADRLGWIFRTERPTEASFRGQPKDEHTIGVFANGRAAPCRVPVLQRECCAFSEGCRDYEDAPDRDYDFRNEVVRTVHAALSLTGRGIDLQLELLDRLQAGQRPAADAGLADLFEAKRKGVALAETIVAALGPHWAARRAEKAIPAIRAILQAQGFRSSVVTRNRARRAEKSARYAMSYPGHLVLEDTARAVRDGTIRALDVGIELINLTTAVKEAVDGGTMERVNAVGAALDAFDKLTDYVPRLGLEPYELASISTKSGTTLAIKVAPIALVSAAIDTALAIADLQEARNEAARAGHFLRVVGSLVMVGAAFVSPAAVILTMIGTALQCLGSYFATQFQDAFLFLRHSSWGVRSAGDKILGAVGLGDEADWYPGHTLDELANDIEHQHDALDRLIYAFRPDIRVDLGDGGVDGGGTFRVVLGVEFIAPKAPRSPDSLWSHDLSVRASGVLVSERGERIESELRVPPFDQAACQDLTTDAAVELFAFDRVRTDAAIRVEGSITFSPAGKEGPSVTKRVEARLTLAGPWRPEGTY